ncbi:hypothetical protein GQ55_9G388500 [Panicum hallii var. hallii]|uniref:Uncharacterized protein n=1 Tax=Panicum hallii var. hallii TaxID=1504633 RepID=A0A2T7C9I3_9POAL|nr:hypothetical protein GQ55_9G388500 [Panicum hallii var. hallii]
MWMSRRASMDTTCAGWRQDVGTVVVTVSRALMWPSARWTDGPNDCLLDERDGLMWMDADGRWLRRASARDRNN